MGKDIKSLTKSAGWTTENVTGQDLQTSALMRIADASEAMAKTSEILTKNHSRMESDLKFYSAGYERRGEEISRLERSNAALRGVIKRMKNKKQ